MSRNILLRILVVTLLAVTILAPSAVRVATAADPNETLWTPNQTLSEDTALQTEWEKTFGGTNYEGGGYSVQETTDGGYIMVGVTESYGAGGMDAYLVKTDGEGNELWHKTYGGSGQDIGYSCQQTSDGGYIITGLTTSFGAGSDDIYLVKTDQNGNKLWQKTFGGSLRDRAQSVQQTSDGGYIIAGQTEYSPGYAYQDVYLVKTDANGVLQWDKTFGGSNYEGCSSVQQTADGGYIMTGHTLSFGAGWYDVHLIKTDADGNELWYKTFGGSLGDYGMSVQQTMDGGYMIAGTTDNFGAAYLRPDVYLVKTDSNGNELWYKTFGGYYLEEGRWVQQTSDGGYIITGNTKSYGAGGNDVYLIKTDADGVLQSDETFGGSNDDMGISVQQTSDGGYVIAGWTESFGAGGGDLYLIKVAPKMAPLSVKVAGEFDYLWREKVEIRFAALVTDAETMQPVSGAEVTATFYFGDDQYSFVMEEVAGSGVYEWISPGTIHELRVEKGVYLVKVQAKYGNAVGWDILLFHVDPPAEVDYAVPLQIVLAAFASAGVTALILKRRRIIQKIRQIIRT